MTPAQLDALIHSQKKPSNKHGERNCPKCGLGYMAYVPIASSGLYSCVECKWIEPRHPPWPKR